MRTLTGFFLLLTCLTVNAQVVKDFDLPEFHSISLNADYTVKIRQFNAQSIKAIVEQEILDQTEILVDNGVLFINSLPEEKGKQSVWSKIDKVKIDPERTIEISVLDIKGISVNSKGKVISSNTLNSDELVIELSAEGQIQIDAKTKNTSVNIFSKGKVSLTGYCSTLEANIFGGGELAAQEFSGNNGKVILRGESVAYINLTEEADITIYGPSTLNIGGNTKSLTKNIYGKGSVVRANLP